MTNENRPPQQPLPAVDTNMDELYRYLGALVGLAAGDALGTTLEFCIRDQHLHHTEMRGGGAFNVAPGEWTDDTAMALCLAESLISRQSFDPHDQLSRYVRWWREGYLACQGRCIDQFARQTSYLLVRGRIARGAQRLLIDRLFLAH